MNNQNIKPSVAIIMGSQSDWETMKFSKEILIKLNIPFITKIISAHRTPDRMNDFAKNAQENSIQVIIAGAGGAAHLPGMVASHTELPVIGVPIKSSSFALTAKAQSNAVRPAVPIIIAFKVVKLFGSLTKNSELTLAYWENPPK